LFLSRAEARDIELQLAAHTPESLLQSFGQDARVLSEHRGLRYVQTHQGLGSVLMEPRWLRRVLLNLLANALNASPPGGTVTLNSVV
jgi:two-component system heavy metal sensor histidine kinase CusS